MSLRWIKECIDARLGSSVSLRTLNGCVRWSAHRLRTNSPLGREFHTCRRRLAVAVLFHSPVGLAATIHQWLVRRTAHRTDALPRHWYLALERALADAARSSWLMDTLPR